MKLAEALTERADVQRRMTELQARVSRNATYQDGDEPAENPRELLAEFETLAARLQTLIGQINLTNNQVELPNGMLMVEALAKRDVLKMRHAAYRTLASEATPQSKRYSRSEIKIVSSVNVQETQKKADELAKEQRELDGLIQQTNWTNDLID